MIKHLFLILCIFLQYCVFCFGGFDWVLGNTSVWLCAAAYCPVDSYLNKTYTSYSAGFIPVYVIDEFSVDVQGFIGYMPNQSYIYVVFRGTNSLKDWINNIHMTWTSYDKCNKCNVHDGIYSAEKKVINNVISYVRELQSSLNNYTIVVTGHSLGAAIAMLAALDILDAGLSPVKMINFGSPRIGNDQFAEYASDRLMTRYRVTHRKDIIPHTGLHPPYTHISGEWYEDSRGIHQCSGYQDSDCADKWVFFLNTFDHLHYLGLYINCHARYGDSYPWIDETYAAIAVAGSSLFILLIYRCISSIMFVYHQSIGYKIVPLEEIKDFKGHDVMLNA